MILDNQTGDFMLGFNDLHYDYPLPYELASYKKRRRPSERIKISIGVVRAALKKAKANL